MYLIVRIQQIAQRSIMIKSIDDVRYVFAEIAANVVVPLQKLRGLINCVRGEYIVYYTTFDRLVKYF